jgi:3-deoxy-7-phosphoheptulonate synthase
MLNPTTQPPLTQPVKVGPVTLGGGEFTVIAGPCAIESTEQFTEIARGARAAGAVMLRGGIYKLRTSPDSFQGLGGEGLDVARAVREQFGLPLVSEVIDPRHIEPMIEVVDMFQVGTRNMFNYSLLKELGLAGKPVLLKRGFSARVEEWLYAAEYVIKGGNPDVVLCERGIRTFETATRNTLDLAAMAHVKNVSALPVLVDPSHGTGRRELIEPMSLAAAAAGADGLLLEVAAHPERALSDAAQTLDLDGFSRLMDKLNRLLPAIERPLHTLP